MHVIIEEEEGEKEKEEVEIRRRGEEDEERRHGKERMWGGGGGGLEKEITFFSIFLFFLVKREMWQPISLLFSMTILNHFLNEKNLFYE